MADAVASAVVQTVVEHLASVAKEEFNICIGFKNNLKIVERRFKAIQLVLQDAEIKQRKSESLQEWLRKLKHAAYDAEDVLDEISIEYLRRELDSKRGMKLNFFLSLRNRLLFRLRMAHQLKRVIEELNVIAKERKEFELVEVDMLVAGNRRFGSSLETRETSSAVNEVEIYGRKEETNKIVEKLLDDVVDDGDGLCVYAIWGMGGVGKTTLAQLVYNDERIKGRFEVPIWVCVSEDFSVARLVRAMIEIIEGCGCDLSELESLQRRFKESLRGRRFFLVLDDVWNQSQRLWDGLKGVLCGGQKGSVVLVTTRNETVASMMGTMEPHNIRFLSDEDSWSLFKRIAFRGREEEENLVEIGKEITKKCRGVPLAINTLGSLMQFKCNESEWLAIKDSEIWNLPDHVNDIFPALRLSYDNLRPQVRQCFAYCCIFPKDHLMGVDELVQLWMANGFISPQGQMDCHLIGHSIFKELVWQSFLQDVRSVNGSITCKMHDLMHDLACSVMRHETYVVENVNLQRIPETPAHLSINSGSVTVIEETESKLKLQNHESLRSLIVYRFNNSRDLEKDFSSILRKQQHLRVLDTRRYSGMTLTNTVCKLKQLRYLAMSCYELKSLPEVLTRLPKLQTLKLVKCGKIRELPKGMKDMKDLCVLDIDSWSSLLRTPPSLGELTQLRGLSVFIVGSHEFQRIDQLKDLDLGGELTIKGLENVRNSEEAKSANLIRKKNLNSLKLYWSPGIEEGSAEHFEDVLEGLQPHKDLKEMRIVSYQGSRFPSWESNLAPEKLTKLCLKNCGRCQHLQPLGKLPALERLELEKMDSIEHLDVGLHPTGPFARLTDLVIKQMPNFVKWTIADPGVCFPCLENLQITGCPKLDGLPVLPTIKQLDISDCNLTLLRSVEFLTSLTSLVLLDIAESNVLPEGLLQNHRALEYLSINGLLITTLSNVLDHLSALRDLRIHDCPNLESVHEGLQHLSSLEHFWMHGCDSIRTFPAAILESLPSLRSLRFHNCKRLNMLSGPMQNSTCLERLYIWSCPEVEHLPESIQQFAALRQLDIANLPELRSLPNWIGSLQSLSELRLYLCDKLISLPDSFGI